MSASEPIDLAVIFGKTPEDADTYLASKGLVTTWSWKEMLDAAHQRSFTVAGLLKLDALEVVRASLRAAVRDGLTYREWVKRITPELEKRGLIGRHRMINPETGEVKTMAPWRLRTIYHTNLQSAYMAGRFVQMKAATVTHPYWQYVAVMDRRTRPAHRALHGRTFRHDDGVWSAGFYPPLGYRCRCRVRPLSDATLKAEGIALSSSQGKLSKEEVSVGRGETARPAMVARYAVAPGRFVATDPGFAHSPADATAFLERLRRQRRTDFEVQG